MLATKLFVPRPPPGLVSRPRLVSRLHGGLSRQLTLVCAPAGFGKTALLADWCSHLRQPVIWLSLDAGDNDPVRFWRHVTAALDRLWPGLAERVAPLLGSPESASFDGLITALVNELAAEPTDAVLVLDDYHLVETASVHSSLQYLLENAPPALHVVLASRADPPLPLARWRAGGRLVELRVTELRFTTDEATAMLQQIVGPDVSLPRGAATRLTARTEGWAAGLQLAGLSLQGQSDLAGLVESFSGSHRYVLDYLTEEVLEHQSEPVREFLLETSVLDRLSGPLCDAVIGRSGSQQMLEEIERANLFLVPLDEVRGWWRYHQLFADLLRARVGQDGPTRVEELHRRAAGWHEEHGTVHAAVRHAMAAGDPVWAARLAERYADELLMRSEGATLQRWLQALPAEVFGSRPRLLLAKARLALFTGHMDTVEELLDAVERALPGDTGEAYEPSVGRAAGPLANVPAMTAVARAFVANMRGEPDRTIEFASRALAELGQDEWMLDSIARLHLAVADWMRGNSAEAERVIATTIERRLAPGARDYAASWCYYLAQVQMALGRLDRAADTYRQAEDLATMPGLPKRPTAGAAYVGLAQLAYQRDDLDGAREHLATALPLCRQLTLTQPLATGLATQALIHQATGDPAGARAAMAEAEQVTPPTVVDLINPVPALRARLLLSQGEVEAAAQWAAERGISAADEPSYPREPAYLALVRVLLGQDRPRDALPLLHRLLTAATDHGRIGSVIEIQALRALALAAAGEDAGALAALAEALTLGHTQGYIRVFVDEGPAMATLLSRLVATQPAARAAVPMEYLARLGGAFERPTGVDPPETAIGRVSVPGLLTSLSDRELDVLRLLAAGKQNQEIAAELFVTLNTVKKHVTHILDKLGATNRTEATVRAREFGLLS